MFRLASPVGIIRGSVSLKSTNVFRHSISVTSTRYLQTNRISNPSITAKTIKPFLRQYSTTPKPEETAIEKEPKEAAAKEVVSDKLFTLPNILTMTRIATTPMIGYFIIKNEPILAMSIFTYSCITDFLDGYIARRFNLKSTFGSILDPMADKFLMTTCTLSLGYSNIIPVYLATLIIGRDVLLSFWAFYIRYSTMKEPKTIKNFIDFRNSSVSVQPSLLGKVNTGLQMVYVGSLVMRPGIEMVLGIGEADLNLIFQFFEYIVASTTVLSGLGYFISGGGIKYLK